MERIKKVLNALELVGIFGIAFFIPLFRIATPIALAFLTLVFLLNGGIPRIAKSFNQKYMWIVLGYLLMLLIGLSYTEQMEAGWFDLQIKLPLVLFPIILSCIDLDSRNLKKLAYSFLFGLLISVVFCFDRAYANFSISGDLSNFHYQSFSFFTHPSYFALYLNFGLFLIGYNMVFTKLSMVKSVFSVFVIFLFTSAIFLLASRLGLIVLFIIILSGSIYIGFVKKLKLVMIAILCTLSLLSYVGYQNSGFFNKRINEAVTTVSGENSTKSSSAARIIVWDLALELILDQPLFGYGTGDVRSELEKKYFENNEDYLGEIRLNAHNQFVQSFIAIGFFGFFSLLLYMYFPLLKNSNIITWVFVAIITMNFLVESMLETQAGVMFYAFFNSILYFNRKEITFFNQSKIL